MFRAGAMKMKIHRPVQVLCKRDETCS